MSAATSTSYTSQSRLSHSHSSSSFLSQFVMDANSVAELLGVSPMYKIKEKERWSSAAHQYQEMLSHGNSPEQTPSMPTSRSSNNLQSQATEARQIPNRSADNHDGWIKESMDNIRILAEHHVDETLSLSGVLTPGLMASSGAGSRQDSRGDPSPNSLELEAIAAVHELSFAVENINVSDMLPRTPELIFVNVTTVEGRPYCLELTFKGWRVCSPRHDCMNSDYQQLALHTRYFETVYACMDEISPGYRQRFGEKLAARLRLLQTTNDPTTAPPPSYAQGAAFPMDMQQEPRADRNTNFSLLDATQPITICVKQPSADSTRQPSAEPGKYFP